MREATKQHIQLAIMDDPEIDVETRKKISALLAGKPQRRRLGTTKQACEILDHCHPITLRRLEQRGHLRAIRLSKRKIRWDLDEVERLANYGIASCNLTIDGE